MFRRGFADGGVEVLDFDTPRSPTWWARVLVKQLVDRRLSLSWRRDTYNREGVRPPLDLLADYLRGEPPLTGFEKTWKPAAREFLRMSRMNYAELIVGSVSDRIVPIGWRTAANDDRLGDAEAKRISDLNRLPLIFGDSVRNMLSMGDGYMIVGPVDESTGAPVITAEDPRDVITAEDPATGRALVGVKVYRDDWDASDRVHIYVKGTPGRVYTLINRAKTSQVGRAGMRISAIGSQWEFFAEAGGEQGQVFPGAMNGRVPVVRFTNQGGVGEFEPHLSALDRINDGIFERVTIAKLQAFRQRAFKGLPDVYPEDHPKAGETIVYDEEAFAADPGALWRLPPDVDIWESSPIDLNPIIAAINDDVEKLAAVTRTPLHMITPDAASGSAEGATTMREAHEFRLKDRITRCEYGSAEVMSLAFAWKGDIERSPVEQIKTIFAPTVHYSLEQKMAAAAQAKAAGLPLASIFTDIMGYAPSDLARLEAERADDLLFAVTTADVAPQPAPVAAPVAGNGPA